MTHLVLLFRSFVTRADLTPGECAAPTLLLLCSSLSTQALLSLNDLNYIRALWKEIRVRSRNVFHASKKFDVHVTVHRDKFLIIKQTICANFSDLFLKWNSTCFGQFLCPSSGSLTVHTAMVYVIQVCLPLRTESGWNSFPSWSCSQAVSKPVWHIPLLCVQWKPPDDWQRNCPKHVEFHFKNKFEKLAHIVGLTIRNFQKVLVFYLQ
jgi:hypothetical protein